MNTYIVSKITTFNEEEELFETKIGLKNMKLLYLAFGKSAEISRERAENLVNLLNKAILGLLN